MRKFIFSTTALLLLIMVELLFCLCNSAAAGAFVFLGNSKTVPSLSSSSSISRMLVVSAASPRGFGTSNNRNNTQKKKKENRSSNNKTKKSSPIQVVDEKKDAIRRALVGMAALQSPNFFQSNAAALASLLAASTKLRVGPSTVSSGDAGLGLFLKDDGATEPIQAGEIVTFYPVHGLGYENNDDEGGDTSLLFFPNTDGDGGCDDEIETETGYVLNLLGNRPLFSSSSSAGGNHPVNFGSESHLIANADPSRECIPDWMGHMVNDGASLLYLSGSSSLLSEKDILRYYEDTALTRNMVYVPFGPAPVIACVATRRILPGEEILTSYGCEYWLEQLAKKNRGMGIIEDDDEAVGLITENVLLKAKELAMDVMTGAKSAVALYQDEAKALTTTFVSARDKDDGSDDD